MSAEPDDLPQAPSLRARWPGLVWAVPLAALIIVAYLGIRALTRTGIEAHVTFGYVEAVTPGNTKVLMKGVEVGHVTRIHVTPDSKHVDVTLSLDRRTRSALNSNTHFWLIGEFPTITDVQSIRAAVAGVIIAMAPGEGGTPTTHFTGLDQPPIVIPGTPGTTYHLATTTLGSIQPGAALLYHGFTIGKVIDASLAGPDDFRLALFVNAPFDRLVKPGALFWSGSPIKFSLTGSGVSAGLSSPGSVLQGSIQFELPAAARSGAPARPGTTFILYDDQATAEAGPTGPEIPYRLVLTGAAGDLAPGAPVSMLKYTIGRVRSARLQLAPGGRPTTEATVLLYPRRLDVILPDGAVPAEWRAATDRAVAALLAQGYRARLSQPLPLVGPHAIAFGPVPGAAPARLGAGSPYPTIPVVGDGGSDDLVAKADDILTKLDRMPLEEIGNNVRQLTANLARISGSGEVKDGIAHLDATLRQLDAITAQVKPKVGPLMAKLDQTAGELQATAAAARATLSGEGAPQGSSLPEAIGQLDQAARSIRALTDYLGRHPEALIRGKAKERK